MKKVFATILAIIMCCSCLVFQGCSKNDDLANSNTNTASDSDNTVNDNNTTASDNKTDIDIIPKKSLKASDLSIQDFKWETVRTKYNGEDCYSFTLVNNSDYDIIDVKMVYQVKDDVADSDLELYKDFMKEHEDYIEEDDSPRDVTLIGNNDVLVLKGEDVTMRLIVGFQDDWWYEYPTEEQFALMEPKELEIGVVGNDNALYIAYYDFKDESWMLDSITTPVDCWSDTEIAQMISRPAEAHHVVVRDEADEFKVYSYGVTAEAFKQYVEDIKNAGFTEDSAGETYFEGIDAAGYEVELWYYEDEESLSITIEKND